MQRKHLFSAVAGAALLTALIPVDSAQAQTRTTVAQRIVCESSLNRDAYCRADTRDGVALVRSLGRERCTIGRNWGYDRNGIWVANGCKAEFAIGNSGNGYGWGWGNRFTGYVYCESIDNRRNECRIDTRGGVRLINQVSRSPCVQGRTWGHTDRSIWVGGGCRGEFEVKLAGPDIPPPRPISGPGPGPSPGPAEALVLCESLDGRDRFCRLPLDADRVELERQISRSPCVEGQTWGYRQSGIYVTNGCRAEFRVLDYRGDRGRRIIRREVRSEDRDGDIDQITCGSDGMRRQHCSFQNRGVRLVQQLSRAPCVEDRTWGHDRQGVWVERGCRAVFDLIDRDDDVDGDWDDDDRNEDGDWDDDDGDRDYDRD